MKAHVFLNWPVFLAGLGVSVGCASIMGIEDYGERAPKTSSGGESGVAGSEVGGTGPSGGGTHSGGTATGTGGAGAAGGLGGEGGSAGGADCGNGVIEGNEACDDSNPGAGDGCSAVCEVEPGWFCSGQPSRCAHTCGNGMLDGAEECDDRNSSAGDGCGSCDVEFGFHCAGEPSVCESTCGDGDRASDEECDDDNTTTESCDYGETSCTVCDDACRETAGATHYCGDDTIQADDGEDCDDGNAVTEECAYGAASCTVCSASCHSVSGQTRSCGDGVIQTADGETCDDGDRTGGDGCSATCTVETGWGCTGSPSVCVPPSCNGLDPTCGPNHLGGCCGSNLVPGTTTTPFNRSNNASYPAMVSTFRLDTYEATVGRFRKFEVAYGTGWRPAAGSGKNPNNSADPGWSASWTSANLPVDQAALTGTSGLQCSQTTRTPSPSATDNKPQNCLTWYVAYAFCIWDGGRLPTELEWNYAAAGGLEQRLYPWGPTDPGMDANLAVYGCYYPSGAGGSCGAASIAPVGSIPAGNSAFGQADMAGNLWEWNLDWNGTYPTPCTNCANFTSSSGRISRGGTFDLATTVALRTTNRNNSPPDNRSPGWGVRCARTP